MEKGTTSTDYSLDGIDIKGMFDWVFLFLIPYL